MSKYFQPSAWESLRPRDDAAVAEVSEADEADRRRLLEVTLPRLMWQVIKILKYYNIIILQYYYIVTKYQSYVTQMDFQAELGFMNQGSA